MFLLYNFAHCSYWVSSSANYILGGTISFFLNKYFTFENKTWKYTQVIKFTIAVVISYLAGYGIAKQISELILINMKVTVRENIAMLVGMCIYTVLNYSIQRFWVFKKV